MRNCLFYLKFGVRLLWVIFWRLLVGDWVKQIFFFINFFLLLLGQVVISWIVVRQSVDGLMGFLFMLDLLIFFSIGMIFFFKQSCLIWFFVMILFLFVMIFCVIILNCLLLWFIILVQNLCIMLQLFRIVFGKKV